MILVSEIKAKHVGWFFRKKNKQHKTQVLSVNWPLLYSNN
jgi:hypothetical protein